MIVKYQTFLDWIVLKYKPNIMTLIGINKLTTTK